LFVRPPSQLQKPRTFCTCEAFYLLNQKVPSHVVSHTQLMISFCLGLECWRCDNQGSSPLALACMDGILKADDVVKCNPDITHCETQWIIPEGVTKGIGAKITRDCGKQADVSQFTDGCLQSGPDDMEMSTESCYCSKTRCNGKEMDPASNSTSATRHPMYFHILLVVYTTSTVI